LKRECNPNTMRWPAALAPVLLGLVLLTGCKKDDRKTDSNASAAGEILPGSASDAMLPYDTVRSQPPLLSASDTPGQGDGEGAVKPAARSKPATDAADATPTPASAATPESETTPAGE